MKNILHFQLPAKIFVLNEDNMLIAHKTCNYNPNDTTMDISWCETNNEIASLMVGIDDMNYYRAAHLQVKASTSLDTMRLNQYPGSPVVVFDMLNDIQLLRVRYPYNTIISAREINPKMQEELEFYYKQILAFASGITNSLEISREEYYANTKLQFIMGLDMNQLIEPKMIGVDIEKVKYLLGKQPKRIEVTC